VVLPREQRVQVVANLPTDQVPTGQMWHAPSLDMCPGGHSAALKMQALALVEPVCIVKAPEGHKVHSFRGLAGAPPRE